MKKLINQISEVLTESFLKAGYDEKYGVVSASNRPDLCQYQCNGALAAAKLYKKAPIMIASEVTALCKEHEMFQEITAIMPGFINITLKPSYLAKYLMNMADCELFGFELVSEPKTIVVDYGGPNVAKPLHVGHLRPAIIGESVKRILRYAGHKVIGDVHLGDWGLPIGLIITELRRRQPDLLYFNDTYEGEYPETAPFSISELEEIYPYASAYSKEHEDYKEEAKEATHKLQSGHSGYRALWQHILQVSIADLKKNYENLKVTFDLWKKESDAQEYIPDMVDYLKNEGYARISEGALVVDVKKETDTREIPPCIILKSDGSALYQTTDLATLVERQKLFTPDAVIYVVDKRQELHFEQVFRCVKKTKLVPEDMELTFLGFGTMNGKDGKPFKTRDGGIMRLESLIQGISDEVYNKIMQNREMEEDAAKEIAKVVGLAALKYGDLSNQASKDYIFDVDRFTSFEGDTGPYILYTMVRIKSILAKYKEMKPETEHTKLSCWHQSHPFAESEALATRKYGQSEIALMLITSKYNETIEAAARECAPHKICAYIYDLANAFNSFYHENKILAQTDELLQEEWIAVIVLVLRILEQCVDLLGFDAPERM